jgi:hypothetical protein
LGSVTARNFLNNLILADCLRINPGFIEFGQSVWLMSPLAGQLISWLTGWVTGSLAVLCADLYWFSLIWLVKTKDGVYKVFVGST